MQQEDKSCLEKLKSIAVENKNLLLVNLRKSLKSLWTKWVIRDYKDILTAAFCLHSLKNNSLV